MSEDEKKHPGRFEFEFYKVLWADFEILLDFDCAVLKEISDIRTNSNLIQIPIVLQDKNLNDRFFIDGMNNLWGSFKVYAQGL